MNLIQELENYREQKSLKKADMARLFGVPEQNYNNWVYRNSLPKEQMDKARGILGEETFLNTAPVQIRGWVPLISYVQAGNWSETIDIYEPGYGEKVLPTTVPHSQHTFALRVEGASMTRPAGMAGPSFPDGIIIYVDPDKEARIKDYVVARFNVNQATFKQLMLEEGRPVLVPLNPDRNAFPIIREEFEIIGKVIDASWGGL